VHLTGQQSDVPGLHFTSSTVSSLAAYGNTTSVLLDRCSITNNNLTIGDASSISDVIERDVIFVQNSTMIVGSSTFRYNVAPVGLGLGSTLNGKGGCTAVPYWAAN
jgi:hypothetical protein